MKNITVTYEGKEYTLEFTPKTVRSMERLGFDKSSLDKQPVTAIGQLFHGAFLVNHPNAKHETTAAIYNAMPNRDALIAKVGDMYVDTLNAFLGKENSDAKWTANF